jgi:hypothetical protein
VRETSRNAIQQNISFVPPSKSYATNRSKAKFTIPRILILNVQCFPAGLALPAVRIQIN